MFNRRAKAAEAKLSDAQKKIDDLNSWINGLYEESGQDWVQHKNYIFSNRLLDMWRSSGPYEPPCNPFIKDKAWDEKFYSACLYNPTPDNLTKRWPITTLVLARRGKI